MCFSFEKGFNWRFSTYFFVFFFFWEGFCFVVLVFLKSCEITLTYPSESLASLFCLGYFVKKSFSTYFWQAFVCLVLSLSSSCFRITVTYLMDSKSRWFLLTLLLLLFLFILFLSVLNSFPQFILLNAGITGMFHPRAESYLIWPISLSQNFIMPLKPNKLCLYPAWHPQLSPPQPPK